MTEGYAFTTCPKCSKFVVIVDGEGWGEAQFICTCGSAFELRAEDDVDG